MNFDYELDDQVGARASIGLIVLSTDEVLEEELQYWLKDDGVALYVSRVPMAEKNTPDELRAMKDHIVASKNLLPKYHHYDVMVYGCTSASALLGNDFIDDLLKLENTSSYTNPFKALKFALGEDNVESIDVLSPYGVATSQDLFEAMRKEGLALKQIGSFNEIEDAKVSRISPKSIYEAAIEMGQTSTSDALFISCTNMRTKEILSDLSKALGKPVYASNQLLARHIAHFTNLTLHT